MGLPGDTQGYSDRAAHLFADTFGLLLTSFLQTSTFLHLVAPGLLKSYQGDTSRAIWTCTWECQNDSFVHTKRLCHWDIKSLEHEKHWSLQILGYTKRWDEEIWDMEISVILMFISR